MTIKEAQQLLEAWKTKHQEVDSAKIESLTLGEEFWHLLSRANNAGIDLTEALTDILKSKNQTVNCHEK